MEEISCTAIAHPNIALIKYWGNRDEQFHIPTSGSISINLDELFTKTTITFSKDYSQDRLFFNGSPTTGEFLQRTSRFLNLIRRLAKIDYCAEIHSTNNFPTGAGIASSASAFAALSLAASQALHLHLNQKELSRLARLGSGSACRSIPPGFVEWLPGNSDEDSYAISIAPPSHWNLVDCIAVFSREPKRISSLEGHRLANTSPFQNARIQDTSRRLSICREAIHDKDFDSLANIVEQDSTMMHAVMMTSTPPIFYWEPPSLHLMKLIPGWRKSGLPVCYTLDAGPNVHIITTSEYLERVQNQIRQIHGIQEIITAKVGGGAYIVN